MGDFPAETVYQRSKKTRPGLARGGRIERRITGGIHRRSVGVKLIAITEIKPRLNALFPQLFHDVFQPREIVNARGLLTTEPPGLHAGVFDSERSHQTVHFRSVIPHLPFQTFKADANSRFRDFSRRAGFDFSEKFHSRSP